MVWICDKCTEDQHVSCKSQWRCDCKCNIGGNVDITQKGLAIVGGTALAVTGLAITLCTGGLAAAIVGSAMLGAGFGSTWNATAKTIKGERIDGNIYVNDVAFGCVAGVVTSRLGATTETITTNLVQQIVTVGTQKLSESSDMDTDDEIQPSSTTDKQCADTKNELIAVQLYAATAENQKKSDKSLFKEDKNATNIHHDSKSDEQKAAYRSAIRKYDSDIQAEISLRNEAVKHRDISSIQEHQAKIAELMEQKDQEIVKLNTIPANSQCINNDVKSFDSTPLGRKQKLYNCYNTDYYRRLKIAETLLNDAIYN